MARDWLMREAVIDMTNHCIDYGFDPKNAINESEKFWRKHRKMLERVF
jgi:hypothetical protein